MWCSQNCITSGCFFVSLQDYNKTNTEMPPRGVLRVSTESNSCPLRTQEEWLAVTLKGSILSSHVSCNQAPTTSSSSPSSWDFNLLNTSLIWIFFSVPTVTHHSLLDYCDGSQTGLQNQHSHFPSHRTDTQPNLPSAPRIMSLFFIGLLYWAPHPFKIKAKPRAVAHTPCCPPSGFLASPVQTGCRPLSWVP